jgi:hypothetical protein
MLYALWNVINAFESRRWPEAPGEISASYTERTYDVEGTQYAPVVRYRYRVGGLELTGTRVSFGGFRSTGGGVYAFRVTEKYRAGQAVVVRYDPEKPEDCVLEPGLNTALVIQFVAGWAAIGAGAYFL